MDYVVKVTIRETEYALCFSSSGRYLFEELAGYPIMAAQFTRETGTGANVSEIEMVRAITAGMESARRRLKSRPKPWTVEEVRDELLDNLAPQEWQALAEATIVAISRAFAGVPQSEADEPGKAAPTG